MKALTLHQPWASLIALGVKSIETRSWSTKYRGPLAIHAGAKRLPGLVVSEWKTFYDPSDKEFLMEHYGTAESVDLPLGAVVATCTLVDVVPIVGPGGCKDATKHLCVVNRSMLLHSRIDEPWADGQTEHCVSDQMPYGVFTPGRFAWLLADVVPLDPPVPAKGRQGLWAWTP